MAIQDWSENIVVADLAGDPDFTDEINTLTERMENDAREVLLNFAHVKFLNSSNLSRLLKLRKVVLDADRRMILCEIPIQVWGVFLLTGLDALFDVAEDTASGLAALQISNNSGK